MVDLSVLQLQVSRWSGNARRMRSLVTGGSGFLGRHLVAALVQAGQSVRILDPVPPGQLPRGVQYLAGSVCDPAAARRALDDVDCVYHLAAIAHLWAPRSTDFDHINWHGTEVMLAVAQEMGVPRFVHCSSYTTLLPPLRAKAAIDEAIALSCNDLAGPYSLSKFRAEEASRAAATRGQNVIIVNPTVLVGAHDDNFTPGTAMLAQFLDAPIFGYVDVMLNFAHVEDVALGMMLAAEHGRAGERYLLGGENLNLYRVLDVLDRITGCPRRRMRVPSIFALLAGRAAGLVSTYFTGRVPTATLEGVRLALRSPPIDIGKARTELGYKPRSAELALSDAVRWLLSRRSRSDAAGEPIRGADGRVGQGSPGDAAPARGRSNPLPFATGLSRVRATPRRRHSC